MNGEVQENISLKEFSYYKIGGLAKHFLCVKNAEELKIGLKSWRKIATKDEPIFVLGSGSNVLFHDRGFSGLVIKNEMKGINDLGSGRVEFSSGNLFAEAIGFCLKNELSGLEWAGGLPGTIGGAIRGNAGAFGQQTGDCIESVKAINLETLETEEFSAERCRFDYRESIFKDPQYLKYFIISAVFVLKNEDRVSISSKVKEKVIYRRDHQPLEYPSLGSTFKNVELSKIPDFVRSQFTKVVRSDVFQSVPAAYILSEAGLKGQRFGGIEISTKHPNFFINVGGGTAEDVLKLIEIAQQKVREKFSIELEPEISVLDK